jgi:hypothetical protein
MLAGIRQRAGGNYQEVSSRVRQIAEGMQTV